MSLDFPSSVIFFSYFFLLRLYRVAVLETPDDGAADEGFPLFPGQWLCPHRRFSKMSLLTSFIPPDHRPCRPFVDEGDTEDAKPLLMVSSAELLLRMLLQAAEAGKHLRTGCAFFFRRLSARVDR